MDRFALAGDTYLKNRNGVFYLQMRVPSNLVEEVGTTHIRESLKTSNPSEAKRLRNSRLSEIEKRFREAEQRIAIKAGSLNRIDNMSVGQLEQFVSDWLQSMQNESQASYEIYVSREFPDDTDFNGPDNVIRECKEQLGLLEASPSPVRDAEIYRMAMKCAGDKNLSLLKRESSEVGPRVLGIDADREGKPYKLFLELVRKAGCELHRHRIALWNGELHKPMYAEVQHSAGHSNRETKVSLSDLIEHFNADPKRGISKRSAKRKYKYDFLFRLMKEVWGDDRDVKTIDRAACRDVRELLQKLPANATKKFPGLSFEQIAERVSKLSDSEKPPGLDATTLNSHLANLSTFLQFAMNEEYTTKNPGKSLAVEPSSHTQEDRDPFSAADLGQIFSSDLFVSSGVGSRMETFPFQPSTASSRYWISIIALYHGLRANEICQLHTSNVVLDQEQPYFNLTDEGEHQRLKTPSSKREVPFHPVLQKLNFESYVRTIKESGRQLLFPNMKLDSTGYHSRNVTRWFNDTLLVDLKIKRKGLSFHSLRHNFKDAGRSAGLTEQHSMALCGHDEGTVASRYGEGFRARDLAGEIAKIDYPTVGLDSFGACK